MRQSEICYKDTLGGKKSKFKKMNFVSYGKSIGLTDKQIEGVFRRLQKFKKKGIQWIRNSFLSDEMQEDYIRLVEERYSRIND